MIYFSMMVLDLLLSIYIVLTAVRLVRAFFMRTKLIKEIKAVCQNKNYELNKLRSPLISIFLKSKKIDMVVKTHSVVYHVKFISSLSPKKEYHFIDENNYVTYLKLFHALPMASKASETIHFSTFHRLPEIEKKDTANARYILLFNPLPNVITYIAKDGSKQTAGNGSMIGNLSVYNGKGFCTLLEK